MFPFEWVREERWRNEAARVVILEVNPKVVWPAISVQGEWNRNQGIIRGRKRDGLLMEDHIRETLDEDGGLVEIDRAERYIVGPADMRAQVWSAEQHLEAYRRAHPGEYVAGWIGNGNLLSNPHFVAFDGTSGSREIYCLDSERPHLRQNGRTYTCLVARRPGYRPRVTIEKLSFDEDDAAPQVYSADGRTITEEVEYASYGQLLVDGARPIGEEDLARMVTAGEFYDLRHVFLFGRIATGPSRWLDLGLAGFWDERGNMDIDAVNTAIRGEPVIVDVRQFPEGLVRSALYDKGYDEVAQPKDRGTYSLKNGRLRIVLRWGIYPHSMMGIRHDGQLIVVQLEGFSNRVGATIIGAAQIMKTFGAENALMIDNGGDVMMSLGNRMVVSSSENQRNRLRSIIVFRTTGAATSLGPTDLKLVEYPRQHAPML